MRRRTFLQAAGSGALLGSLAGCSVLSSRRTPAPTDEGSPTGTEQRPPQSPPGTPYERFDAVVDLTERGADPDGEEPIDPLFREFVADDTLLLLGDGRYRVGDVLRASGLGNFGLAAAPDARPTLVPPRMRPDSDDDAVYMRLTGSDVLLHGFDVDVHGERRGGEVVLLASSGGFRISDVHTYGRQPGTVDGYRVGCRDPDGTGRVERVRMRDGAREGYSATGVLVAADHAGELHVVDCEFWHFPSKGVYGSAPASDAGAGGTVHVEGGLFKNNNDCDVRIGSPGSTVRNIVSVKEDTRQGETVTWKDPIPRRYWDGRRDIVQTRSIRLKNGSDVLVEGCEFRHEVGGGVGVVTVEGSHGGGTTIRDCRVDVSDVPINPVRVGAGAGAVTLRNLEMTGDARGRAAVVVVGAERSGTAIEGCRVRLSSGDGVRLIGAEGVELSSPDIEVPGSHVVFGPNRGTRSPSATDDRPVHGVRFRLDGDQAVTYRLRVSDGIRFPDSSSFPPFTLDSAEARLRGETGFLEFLGDIVELELPAPATAVVDA
jgi:hypothetical protein